MALDFRGIASIVEDLFPWDTVQISAPRAGKPVFDDTSGEYSYPEPDILYEGRGAVQPTGTAAEVVSTPPANLPWVPETRSKYRMFTPVDAPAAEKDQIVTVIAVHEGGDLALLGREWRVQDPGGVGTISVVRTTALDQIQQTREAT